MPHPDALSEQADRRAPIAEDMRFQRRSWLIERVCWTLWLVVVVATLTGLFSHGPLSGSVAAAANGLSVGYERFQRETRLEHFTVTVPAPNGNEVAVRLNRAFGEAYNIETVEPQPIRASAGRDTIELAFAPASGQGLVAWIGARPRRWGLFELAVAVAGEAPATFRVLIYP